MVSKENKTSAILRAGEVSLFIILCIFLAYVFIIIQNIAIIAIMSMLVFALALPVITNIFKISSIVEYQLNEMASVFGLYTALLLWVNSIGIDFGNPHIFFFHLVLVGISLCVALPIHVYTRELSVIKGLFGKDEVINHSGKIIAVIVLGAFVAFNISNTVLLDLQNISLIGLILGLYAFSSASEVNSAYRKYKLHLNLKIEDTENKIEELKTNLVKKFPEKRDEIDFLAYLLTRMTYSFVSGDFESCFIDAMKICRDETLLNQKKTHDYYDKITSNEQRTKFRKIRVALVHSVFNRGKNKEIMSKEKQLKIKTDLFQECLEIQKVVFELVSSFCTQEEEK